MVVGQLAASCVPIVCRRKKLASLTETAASALIEHARSQFDTLRVSSSRFNALTHDLKMRFCVIEDYVMGTAVIVELVGNELVWSL